MNKNNFPLKNEGKPIYDPFEGEGAQEVSIGVIEHAAEQERREYEVHRACGHCSGTGKRKDDKSPGIATTPKCSQCILGRHVRGKEATSKGVREVWGRTISLYAHELTDAEIDHLEPNKKLGAIYEIGKRAEQHIRARIQADEEYEGRKTVIVSRVRTFA